MKILDVDGFQHGIKEIEETLSSQKDQVEQMERAVQDVVHLDDAFKGEGGNAIRDFYRSQHLPMLEEYQLFLSDYQTVIRQMKEALDHVEPSSDGFMRQSFLDNEVEEGLHRARQITVEMTGEANAAIRSVSDIVSVPRIQDWSFLQQVTHAQEEKERSLRKLHEFDHTQTASLSSLEEQVHTMTQQIARLQTVFQKGKLGIIEKKAHQEDSSFLSKLSEFTSVMAKNKVSEFLGTVEGALYAIVDIVSDLVDTLIALFTDPIGFFKGIIHTVLHPIDTAKYIWKDLKQSFEEEVVNGDVRSRARYFSYAGTYIAASIFGAKGVDKVGKMGKAGKMSSKTEVPYNVMTTAKIKSFIHNGVKSTFGKVEDTAHQLLSSRTGKRALGLNAFSGHLQELFRKTKHVLNPEKVKSVMERTYHKVVVGPVSRVAQSDVFSRMGKVLLNEDGHVVVSGKDRVRRTTTAEQIIADRTKGLELKPHPIQEKQLSAKKMKELRMKIESRTITKAEYEQYIWNKKFAKHRASGVTDFWYQERQRILNNETPTREWNQEQLNDILNGKKPKVDGEVVQGHHSYSASQYPHLANKGEIIYPATPYEHFRGWHGGNWKKSLPGKPINPIDDF
jgi:LXG domain of WXG superfamily/GHH signature containing HNH/Endo VII superfamily nuclease toxin